MKLNGIPASNGISIAKAFQLKQNEINIKKEPINDIKKEIEKLNKAIDLAVKQIEKIKSLALKNINEEHAAIFDAHIQVATDPMLKSEYEFLIDKEKICAQYVVWEVSQKYIDMFNSMEDKYMQERAADIKDVSEKIILNLLGKEKQDLSIINEEVIIVSNDISPSETSQLNKKYIKGFVTNIGGTTSHSAIMARTLNIPAIVGLENITEKIKDGDVLAINGFNGEVYINPSKDIIEELKKQIEIINKKNKELEKFINFETETKDNHKVKVAVNIGSDEDIDSILKYNPDGIGLVRSEFLYMNSNDWPTEEKQFQAYKKIIESMKGKQVIIRTLDIGGDKNLKYYNFKKETNPFLGFRAIRFCLANKDIFKTQLRALIRASEFGKLGIMFPMIATIDEFKQAKDFYLKVYDEVKKENPNVSNNISIGMMVEIPSAAIKTDMFCKYADFVSIGTNDLIQYSMAVDRINEEVSYLYQPLNPSILKLIKMIIDGAHKNNKWVGMCGEMANNLECLPILLGFGLDEFSVSGNNVLASRELISKLNYKKCKEISLEVLEAENSDQVISILNKFKF